MYIFTWWSHFNIANPLCFPIHPRRTIDNTLDDDATRPKRIVFPIAFVLFFKSFIRCTALYPYCGQLSHLTRIEHEESTYLSFA